MPIGEKVSDIGDDLSSDTSFRISFRHGEGRYVPLKHGRNVCESKQRTHIVVCDSWQNINGDVYNGSFQNEKRHGYGGRMLARHELVRLWNENANSLLAFMVNRLFDIHGITVYK